MILVLVVIGVVVVLAIAVLAVGTVVARLGPEPARQVFEHDEALAFVVEALPAELTAQLSFQDVGRILRLHLDFLHRQGVARSGGDLPAGEEAVVVEVSEGVAYVLRRAALVDFRPAQDHVAEVVAAQLAYFEAIGALEEVDRPEPDGPTPDGPEPETG